MKKIWRNILFLNLMVLILVTTGTIAQNLPLNHYESAFLAQEVFPKAASALDWFPDDYEVQGVTNDGSNWFFTITDQDKTHGIMWKIPKSIPLNGNVAGKPGVMKIHFNDTHDLKNVKSDRFHKEQDLWHWGDPDHLIYNNEDYIIVPINSKPFPAIICFKADDLSYTNYTWLDNNIEGGGGWCAIGKDNDLYCSLDDPTSIARYSVNWEKLINKEGNHHLATYIDSFSLTKNNSTSLNLTDVQGGEFTPNGEMLYLVSGRGYCAGNGAPWTQNDGIHAIETNTWSEVAQSFKGYAPNKNFSYDYNPECIYCCCIPIILPFFIILSPYPAGTDTPEGLTFWDLEDGSAPGIRGSLHVLLDRYVFGTIGCDDEIFFHHYSSNLNVDNNSPGGQGLLGTPDNPFSTLNEAISQYPIWDGAQITLRKGEYQLTGILNKRIKITTKGGVSKVKR